LESAKKPNLIFQIHLFFTFFLFLLLPCINNHFQPDLSESVFLLLVLVNTLLGLALCVMEGQIIIPFRSAFLFFYAFCFFAFIHYFNSEKSEEGRQFINGISLLMLFVFNISQVCRTKKIALLFLSAVIFSGILQIILGISQNSISVEDLQKQIMLYGSEEIKSLNTGATAIQFQERINARHATGWFIYPNALAAYLGLFFFALVGFYLNTVERKFSKGLAFLFVLLAIFGCICIYCTGSKGTIFALVLTVFIYFGFFIIICKKQIVDIALYKWFTIGLGLVLLIAPVLFQNILSMKVRLNYWQAGWAMFKEEAAYFFGLGAGGFSQYYLKYKLPLAEEVQKPHNYFVTLLVEQGLLGLLLFCLFLWFIFLAFIKKESAAPEEHQVLDEPMPYRVYLVLFFAVFSIFMLINPAISNVTTGLSLFTLVTLLLLFLILVLRFLKNKNVFKVLDFEKRLNLQMILLGSCLVVCFTDLICAFSSLENWPNFQEFSNMSTGAILLILIVLFFVFFNKREILRVSHNQIKLFEIKKLISLLLVLFFVLMIAGDMVGEYISFVVTFIVLVMVFGGPYKESSITILFPNRIVTIIFAILSFAGAFVLFEKIAMPSLTIARFHHLFQQASIDDEKKKQDGKIEIMEGILETGQVRFPEQLFFPLEKAKLYESMGQKYFARNTNNIAGHWYNKALEEIDICIKIAPNKANLYDFKADLLEKMSGSLKEIEDIRQKAQKLYPSKAYYCYKLAMFYQKSENQEKAREWFEKALYLHKNTHRYTRLIPEEFEITNRYIIENK